MSIPRSVQQRALGLLNTFVEPAARARWTDPLPVGAGLTVLETVGRRSGRPRSRPLLVLRLGDRRLMATVRTSSDWVANLSSSPEPQVWIGGAPTPATATVARTPFGSIATVRAGDDHR